MKRPLVLLLLAAGPLAAQIPQAQAVDPALQADPAQDMFQRGMNLYNQSRAATTQEARTQALLAAAAVFNQYLAAFPNNINSEPALLYEGQSLYLAGKVDEAKRIFQTLIAKYNHGTWVGAAAYTLAQDFYSKKDYASAAPLFQKCAENPPRPEDRVRGYYLAAGCYAAMGNQDRIAGDLYRKILEDPKAATYGPLAKFGLGVLYLKTNKHADALPLFESVIASDAAPEVRGEAALKAALSALKLPKPDPELADKYLKLIAVTPGMEAFRPDAVSLLMEGAFSKKDYAGVIDVYRKSGLQAADGLEGPADIKAPHDDRKAQRLIMAGRALFQMKKSSEALSLFRSAERSVSPQNDLAFQAAYYRLLCFYEIDGEHLPDQVDAFLQLYRTAKPLDPKIHTAMLMKAEALFDRKDYEKAAPVYNDIDASLVPESSRAGLLYKRGCCLVAAGDPQGAVRSFSKFITDFPNDKILPKVLAERASAYAAAGENQKAIEDYDKIRDSDDAELSAIAWLHSARIRRDEGNMPDMILRYRGLLTKPAGKYEAEANYFIGWGMLKNNDSKSAPPFLEKARQVDAATYGKHAGLALGVIYFTTQNLDKLSAEIDTAIEKGYVGDFSDQTLQWAGMQSFYAGRFGPASRYLERISSPDEPRETAKEVWRYLGKAKLENSKPDEALSAIENYLAVEKDNTLRADALLDKARSLYILKKDAESRKTWETAADLHPDGRTKASLAILSGDLYMRAGDFEKAVQALASVPQSIEDRDLKPLALFKLSNALEKAGKKDQAEQYRGQLKKEFPTWQAPKEPA